MSAMSATTVKQLFTRNPALKLLCLAVAISIWLLSATSRRVQVDLSLPLKVADIPAGYSLSSRPPAAVTYTLSGPSILIDGLLRSNPEVKLSMAGAATPGTTAFMHLESYLKLPEGVMVIRISPATLELSLEPGHKPAGGQHP
jgi:hypothetical protein